MYVDKYSKEITKKLTKLNKKDAKHYQNVYKKIDWILEHPKHKHKFLSYEMKGVNRVHVGHFVLIFVIDHSNELISFEDYDHHDKIYK